jgi:hypothetical protein
MGRGRNQVQPQVANPQPSPILDEGTFQQILQAAYIIQEQNDRRRETRPKLDPSTTLAIIAETQELLHSHSYDVNEAAQLIAERLEKITNATGVAIALIEEDQLRYCAALGDFASLAGSSGRVGAEISEFFQEGVAAPELNDNGPAFFPIYREGRIAGVLQLGFAETESIQEHEIRSCQVMAGLLGETISRASELEWKQSLAAERATMLEALERLRPQLERLASEPSRSTEPPATAASSSRSETVNLPPVPQTPEAADLAATLHSSEPGFAEVAGQIRPSETCGNCGFRFSDGEMFCGRCGTPRAIEAPTPLELPFDAIAEETNQRSAAMVPASYQPPPDGISDMPVPAAVSTPSLFRAEVPAVEGSAALAIEHHAEPADAQEEQRADLEIVESPESVTAKSPWSSAVKTRKWLASLEKADSHWLAQHSGDLSLGIAALVLVLVLAGWNPHPTPNKPAHNNAPPQPSLTLFERMLVGLGLAEAPATPVSHGNPNAQVWEDLHTGLYYCAGSDLYGKSEGGKLTSQRDAQLDQFEPAARKTCE